MKLFAGTSKGLFVVEKGQLHCVLKAKGVREVVQLGDDLFAGTSEGLYISNDQGASWKGPHLSEFAIWQIRGDKRGWIYVGTHPAELFRSVDGGNSWQRLESLGEIVKKEGLIQQNDPEKLEKMISEVLSKNQDKVTQYKSGKEKLFGFFVGEVMKISKGKANPQLVNKILKKNLSR